VPSVPAPAPADTISTISTISVADLPAEAFATLARSLSDSCAICAERHRKAAFEELALVLRPGVRVRSSYPAALTRGAGETQELELPVAAGGLRVTFRFHTADDHLVGIAEEDLTGAALAARWRGMPEEAKLAGTIEVIPFDYGDGPAFLFLPASGHLQIQCKVLEVEGE